MVQPGRVVFIAGLAACLLLLLPAAPALAAFEGSPGKIAYITGTDPQILNVWDPADAAANPADEKAGVFTADAATYALPTQATISLGAPSAPAWSPDGTRIAYAKSVDGTGNSPTPVKHTAIFVFDLRTMASTQITHPIATLVDDNPVPTFVEHSASDWSPAWSPDGGTLAFIRQFYVTDDDTGHVAQRGQNLWTIPSAGGVESKATSYTQEPPYPTNGAVWIPGTSDVMVAMQPSAGQGYLGRQPLGGGGATQVATGFIFDYDVSPDGKKFGYSVLGAAGFEGFAGDVGGVATGQGTWGNQFMRFSGSGDGLLRTACLPRPEGPPACGVVDRMLEDPQADIRAGEPDRFVLDWRDRVGVSSSGSLPGRVSWDVQPEVTPVIFVPGFLGSIIECGGTELWPHMPLPNPLGMRLGPSGLDNVGCATAKPGDVLRTVLFKDIYDTVGKYVENTLEPGRGTMFGWDWRMRPQESLDRLDKAVDDALAAPGRWKEQKARRVVLWGHSYGGLLIRTYLALHPDKVARVLTVGTPSWGAPKSLFSLAYGIETPEGGVGMDLFFKNSELQEMAVNLAGLYQLYPSPKYTPGWLRVDGAGADLGGLVSSLGGNAALLTQAQGYHTAIYDRFYDNGGRIDVHSVVGTGVPTFGSLNFLHQPDGTSDVEVGYVNGDGTVPGLSATQGPIGPLPAAPADPIHIQNTCSVSHVPLANDPKVTQAYGDWILFGRVPRVLPGQCGVSGGSYVFEPGALGVLAPRRATRRVATGAAMSPQSAEEAALVDVVDLPDRVVVVTDDRAPVTMTLQIDGASFTYAPITDAGEGTKLAYGPLKGTLVLTPGPPGGAPAVTIDGQSVAPHAPVLPPITPGGGGVVAGVAPPSPGAPKTVVKRLSISGRPRLVGRKLTFRIAVPGAGTVRAVVRQRTGRRAVLGSARSKSKAMQTLTLTVRLRKRQRAAVRLTITYTPAKGPAQTTSALVKPR